LILPVRSVQMFPVLLVGILLLTPFGFKTKGHHGFRDIAARMANRSDCTRCVLMTSSPWTGDGMLITELASLERRPDSLVLRADKLLSRSRWDGTNYELAYDTPALVNEFLLSIPVDFVVIHDIVGIRDEAHHRLLLETMRLYGNDWKLVDSYSRPGSLTTEILVYRTTHARRERGAIQIDMGYSLGRPISVK
jgi:hypothetical protein